MHAELDSLLDLLQSAKDHTVAAKKLCAEGTSAFDEIDDIDLALGWAMKKLHTLKKHGPAPVMGPMGRRKSANAPKVADEPRKNGAPEEPRA